MGLPLPDELLISIVEWLPSIDIKACRLTSRHLNEIAAPLLYRELFISSHPLDLEVFRLVIDNPLLRKGVKQVVWDDTTFCDVLTDRKVYFRTNEEGIAVWGQTELSKATEEGFNFYVAACHAHHAVRRARLDEKALIEGLPLLTSLETVVLTNRNLQPGNEERYPPKHDVTVGRSPTVQQWLALPLISGDRYPSRMPITPSVSWAVVDEVGEDISPDSAELEDWRRPDYHEENWDEDYALFWREAQPMFPRR